MFRKFLPTAMACNGIVAWFEQIGLLRVLYAYLYSNFQSVTIRMESNGTEKMEYDGSMGKESDS